MKKMWNQIKQPSMHVCVYVYVCVGVIAYVSASDATYN